MSAPLHRPLPLPEILKGSLALFRRHRGVLLATVLAVHVPLWLVSLAWVRLGPSPSSLEAAYRASLAWSAVEWVVGAFVWSAMVRQVAWARAGEEPRVGEGLREALAVLPRVLGAGAVLLPWAVVTGLFVWGVMSVVVEASMSGAVPEIVLSLVGLALGLLLLAAWAPVAFAVLPAVVVDGLAPLAAVQRSHRFWAGERLRVFAVAMAAWALMLLPRAANALLLAWYGRVQWVPDGNAWLTAQLFARAVDLGTRAAALALAAGCVVLLYEDRHAREEAGAVRATETEPGIAPA